MQEEEEDEEDEGEGWETPIFPVDLRLASDHDLLCYNRDEDDEEDDDNDEDDAEDDEEDDEDQKGWVQSLPTLMISGFILTVICIFALP